MSKDKIVDAQKLRKKYPSPKLKADFPDLTDPTYIGPGMWTNIHQQAMRAKTRQEQLDFIKYMTNICIDFPCLNCRTHCTKYIEKCPMKDYMNVKIKINNKLIVIGMFIWSWKFHNAVNTRLNKSIMNWDTAFSIYSDKGTISSLTCSATCIKEGKRKL